MAQHGQLAQCHQRRVDLVVATLGLLLGQQIECLVVGMHGQPGLGCARETYKRYQYRYSCTLKLHLPFTRIGGVIPLEGRALGISGDLLVVQFAGITRWRIHSLLPAYITMVLHAQFLALQMVNESALHLTS